MGLDILIYNKENKRADICELTENIHYWLFNEISLNEEIFNQLFKIKNYYKTDVTFSDKDLDKFISELTIIKQNSKYEKEIDNILYKIQDLEIQKIRVTGD